MILDTLRGRKLAGNDLQDRNCCKIAVTLKPLGERYRLGFINYPASPNTPRWINSRFAPSIPRRSEVLPCVPVIFNT